MRHEFNKWAINDSIRQIWALPCLVSQCLNFPQLSSRCAKVGATPKVGKGSQCPPMYLPTSSRAEVTVSIASPNTDSLTLLNYVIWRPCPAEDCEPGRSGSSRP